MMPPGCPCRTTSKRAAKLRPKPIPSLPSPVASTASCALRNSVFSLRLCSATFAAVKSIAFLFAFIVCLNFARADDWPQWLGPQRDGVWRERGILKEFPSGGPKVRWRTPVGAGYAGPAVVAGRVYLTDRIVAPKASTPADPFQRGKIPGSERVLCL